MRGKFIEERRWGSLEVGDRGVFFGWLYLGFFVFLVIICRGIGIIFRISKD